MQSENKANKILTKAGKDGDKSDKYQHSNSVDENKR